jgi:hypothetical protein
MEELKNVSTRDLAEELRKREAVKEITAEPYQAFEVSVDGNRVEGIPVSGPAVILVVWD